MCIRVHHVRMLLFVNGILRVDGSSVHWLDGIPGAELQEHHPPITPLLILLQKEHTYAISSFNSLYNGHAIIGLCTKVRAYATAKYSKSKSSNLPSSPLSSASNIFAAMVRFVGRHFSLIMLHGRSIKECTTLYVDLAVANRHPQAV